MALIKRPGLTGIEEDVLNFRFWGWLPVYPDLHIVLDF
jgi:hypothetical protein